LLRTKKLLKAGWTPGSVKNAMWFTEEIQTIKFDIEIPIKIDALFLFILNAKLK
jgi:hypothetical protein